MEGSTVRGQQRVPIVQLNASQDLKSFQAELVRFISGEFRQAEVFFGIYDSDSKSFDLPSWIRTHLERHSGLQKKLEQGEMVGISTADDAMPRPAAVVRSSVVLIPVVSGGLLNAAIAVASSLDGPQLSAEDIEAVRQFAYEAAPILNRLQEIEILRRENRRLLTKAERADWAEERLMTVLEEKHSLDAVLQMRSHQQVNVAHELRTPMAAIRGYARMILDGRGGEINDTQRQYLRIVTDNTNRLIALVAWMSYVAELSAQHLRLETFDFRDLWAECVNRNTAKLTEKSLKLKQNLASEPFLIIGDREKLSYVLNEIINIGANLAATNGTITADLWHGREKEVSFKLTETGAELPPDVLSKLFDRPLNTATKPAAQSTDSGAISLSGVYDIVGMHGGRVFVNSIAGQGATFLFTLPAVMSGEENSHEQAVNSSRRRR
jgi:signal transduction histidine kinase